MFREHACQHVGSICRTLKTVAIVDLNVPKPADQERPAVLQQRLVDGACGHYSSSERALRGGGNFMALICSAFSRVSPRAMRAISSARSSAAQSANSAKA